MSTQQFGEDEIERRLRSLSADFDPDAPRDIYAYIRALPAEHPVRGRNRVNPVRLALGRPAPVAAVFASLALLVVIVVSMVLRSAGPAASNTASGTPQATTSATRAGHFTPTGAMSVFRYNVTATRLLDGRVLITGGADYGGAAVAASAELYNPATGTFSPTGAMTTGRDSPTATLLQDGRVLIVGDGETNQATGSYSAAADLYDPATGKFSATGSLECQFPTSTLLADGRVLIVGCGTHLYDPATGKFSSTGSPIERRLFSTATLLKDGRVLIVGGRKDGTTASDEYDLKTAELYDPASGTFSATGSMSMPREGQTATLLPDGRVLVARGSASVDSPGLGSYTSAEIYNPVTGTFSVTGSMATGPQEDTATLLNDGRVLIAGGQVSGQNGGLPNCSAELYDPATGTFSQIGNLRDKAAITSSATLLADGRVLLLGSEVDGSGNPDKNWAELYKP